MKTRYFKLSLIMVFMLAVGLTMNAQTLREEDQKEFNATNSTELAVDNQFGNITVTDWDQNKVSVTWIVEVTDTDEARGKKLMDRIKVEFTEKGNRIEVETKFGENGKLDLKDNKSSKQSFRIDYIIKCPKYIGMELTNQFGDIVVASHTGPFKADLQFGSMNAVSLTGPETSIEIQFGKLTIGTLKNAEIEAQHCESVKITECEELSIEAQFSNVDLGTAGSVSAELNNAQLSVETLSNRLELESNMGSVKVDKVAANFKSIQIEQNMGDITLGVDPDAGYKLDASVSMGSIKVPEGVKVKKEPQTEAKGVTADQVTGVYGNGNSTIEIECNMGSVRIK